MGVYAAVVDGTDLFLDPVQCVQRCLLELSILGIVISALQMRRARNISRILRQAHEVQQEVDKAEAEKKAREEEEAAKEGRKPKAESNGSSNHSSDEAEEA